MPQEKPKRHFAAMLLRRYDLPGKLKQKNTFNDRLPFVLYAFHLVILFACEAGAAYLPLSQRKPDGHLSRRRVLFVLVSKIA